MSNPPDTTRAVRPRRIGWGAAAWIAILYAIGFVQIVREQWFDAAIFLVIATALAIDAARGRAPAGQARRAWIGPILLLVVGAIAIAVPRHSLAMQLLLCGAGLLVLLLSWRQTAALGAPWPPGLARLARAWALILVAGCLWELGEFVIGQVRPEKPAFALSDLLDPFLSGGPGKALFVVAWIAGGCFLVMRGRR